VQGIPDRGASRPGGAFSFVGRGRELDLLLAALRHPPAIVVVEGEAGIGKSRLVREAAAVLCEADGRVLTGYCHPLREPVPFGPVVDAFQEAGPLLPRLGAIPRTAGALAPLLPDLADRLPQPPPRTGDARADRYQLVQGVRSFLAALGPVVLVIEDVHWADEVTSELLLVLSRDMPGQLGLVLTFRGQDMRPGTPLASALRRQPGIGGATIHLAPLSEQDVHELVVDALGRGADAALGRAVYDRSEGLALVAEEDLITLREHGERGRPVSIADLERADIPQGLREAFTERFDALPPAGKAIVEAAAVLGVPADEDVLAKVAGLDGDEGQDGIIEALRLAVLRESGPATYAFRHALAQLVAHQNIPGPRRRRLHLQAIHVLEAHSPPPLVQIAHHTLQSGDREGWLRRAEEAAAQAAALGDDGTAAALLHDILDQPGLPEQTRARAALALSRIAGHGADYVVNAAVLRRILADPRLSPAARGEIRLSLGLLMINHGGDRAGIQEIEQAAGELAAYPDRVARAMIALAMNERDGASNQAWEWMARAERTLGDGSLMAMRAAVEATRLTLMAREGDPAVWDALERMSRQAVDLDVLRETNRAVYNVGELAIELGRDRRAEALLTESHALTKIVSWPQLESYTRIALLRLQVLAGDWDEIDERFGVLEREYPDIVMGHVERSLMTGRVAAARGRHVRARELFTTAADVGPGETQVTNSLRSAAGLVALRLAEGAARDAWATAAPAVAVLRGAAAWARASGLVPLAVEAALACGQHDAAQSLAEDVERGLTGRDAPAASAELHLASGILLGHSGAAATRFAQAHELWVEIGRPYEAAQAAERLGSALAADDDPHAATHLDEALAVYLRLNATYDAARCQRTLKHLGLSGAPARGRRGYGVELSPRERQVAELLARGATNHEIAQALFLSPRTVELHVAHALKKLGTVRKGVSDALEALRRSG
jgi:DNA-binding CsgD family transcriptional regulator